ncbi:transmembrane domain-containing protein [Cryptosporidium canis]|uniref:Transmembrane domain-containing protein n=1 Tax=Cryptosporidium canis TaxID=195482 RepID=A0ABQ8PAG0_9CRYT|nr:transmembrane domain-containing protein [Cryptosporidium canis]KAJ1614528.1 transmembrane domain-containing protein [Cryptosporidium canis]
MSKELQNEKENSPLIRETEQRTPYGVNRYLLLIIYCIFCGLTTSAIQQSICIRFIMNKLGAYEWICDGSQAEILPTGAKCKAQDNYITTCWTAGIMAPNIILSVLGGGKLFDNLGPKLTGLIGQLMFMIGLLIFCISNQNLPLYPLGFILIGLPQGPIFNSVVSICNLFPNHGNKIISILSTMGDVSAFVFYLIYHFHELSGMSIRSILAFYSIIVCGSLAIVSIFLIPESSFSRPQDTGKTESDDSDTVSTDPTTSSSAPTSLHNMALLDQLKSSFFMLLLPYFTLAVFRSDSIKVCLDLLLQNAENADLDLVRSQMSIFSALQCFSFLFSLINGFIMDNIGVSKGMIFQNSLGILVSTLFLFELSHAMRVISFLVFFSYASCIYSTAYCYLVECFGFSNINFLMALTTAPVGFIYIFIPIMYSKLNPSNFFYFHLFYVISSFIMYITPVNLYLNNPCKVNNSPNDELSSMHTDISKAV